MGADDEWEDVKEDADNDGGDDDEEMNGNGDDAPGEDGAVKKKKKKSEYCDEQETSTKIAIYQPFHSRCRKEEE